MRVLYQNLVDSADTISATTSNSNWPTSNIQDPRLECAWQSLVCDTEQIITLDAGSGNTFHVTSVCLSGHNLQNTATIIFEMDDDSAFGSVNVQATITWREDHAVKFFTGGIYRYMRFRITDTTNPDGFIKVGRIFAGDKLDITPSSYVPFTISNVRTDIRTFTDQHIMYGEAGSSFRTFKYSFPSPAITLIASIRTMFETCGLVKPIWLFNFNTYWTYIAPAYCVLEKQFDEEWRDENKVYYSLEFSETN